MRVPASLVLDGRSPTLKYRKGIAGFAASDARHEADSA